MGDPAADQDPLLRGLFTNAGEAPLGSLPPRKRRNRAGRTQPPHRRPQRRWRWRYGPFRALLLVAILLLPELLEPISRDALRRIGDERTAAAAIGTPNTLPEQTERHQAAPPTPSGAHPPYPLNHTFDAEPQALGGPVNGDFETPAYEVGTRPTNATFDIEPYQIGSEPVNFDFATGDFTAWTTSASGTSIQTSGGPDGYWARMNASGASITTDAFTVHADAQAVWFDIGFFSSGTASVTVKALSGAGYATVTALNTPSCSGCNEWGTNSGRLNQFAGQSIKLRFERTSGTVGIDRVRQMIVAEGFSSGVIIQRRLDGTNPYLRLHDSSILSSAFTVDSSAQILTLRLKGLTTGSDQGYVDIMSGPTFSTADEVIGFSNNDSWSTQRINLNSWSGETIKLRFRQLTGAIGIDDVGIQRVEVPNWRLSGISRYVSDDQGGNAASTGTMTSDAVTLPADIQQVSIRYKVASSGASFYFEMLRGPTYSTVVGLHGTSLPGNIGEWTIFKAALDAYSGQSVKFRIRPQLGSVTVDAIAFEKLIPGWTFASGTSALRVNEDANGTYVKSFSGNGTVTLRSSVIDVGIVNTPLYVDGRSFLVSYEIGFGTGSVIYVDWVPTSGSPVRVYQDAANSPTGFKNGRFTMTDVLPGEGRFWINLTQGGRLYSIADNIARQQLTEPFSQQIRFTAGSSVDTSTGAFGLSEVDLQIDGGSLPFVLARYYRGHSDRYGEFGYRWMHSFDAYAAIYGGDVAIVLGSGREEYFAKTGGTFTAIDPRVKSTLTKDANGDYQYKTKDRLTYNFSAPGDLVSIVDPNGNQLTVYRSSTTGLITSVEDDNARALVFTYDGNDRLIEVSDPTGLKVTYGYDANGDLVSAEKSDGVAYPARTEYSYSRHRLIEVRQRTGTDSSDAAMEIALINTLDEFNRVASLSDGDSHSIVFAYQTPSAGVTRVTDQLGEDTDFYFDSWTRTTFINVPTTDDSVFIYDGEGNLETWVDGSGGEHGFEYDSNANPTTVTDPLNNPLDVDWDSVHNLPLTTTDALGMVTKCVYDSNANLLQMTIDWDSAGSRLNLMTVWTYDSAGNMTSVTVDPAHDFEGNARTGARLDLMTKYGYVDGNRTTEIIDPSTDASGAPRAGSHLNLTTTWTYDDTGNQTSITDPNGATTQYEYLLGRLWKITDADHNVWTYGYDLLGQLVYVIDPLDQQTAWTYLSVLGEPDHKIDAAANQWSYTYNAKRQMTTSVDPLGHRTKYDYDASGRLVRRTADPSTNPSGQSYGGSHLNLVTEYEYVNGRLASETIDPGASPHLNRTTRYTYDDAGRMTGKELPDGAVWTYEYDALGRLDIVTDPMSVETDYSYDAAGRMLSSTIDPGSSPHLNRTTTYTYDAAGRTTSETDPTGTTTIFEYDAASRLIRDVVDPGSSPHLNLVTEYAYDANGNQTKVTVDPGSAPHLNLVTEFEYDAFNRVVEEISDPGASPHLNRSTQYVYDELGQMSSLTLPSGDVIAYEYDELGREVERTVDPNPTGQSGHLSLTTTTTYDVAGRRTSITDPRGHETEFAYDNANRLTMITDARSGELEFSYNAAGEIIELTNPRGIVTLYDRDELGRIISETIDPGASPHMNRTWEYEFDLAGRQIASTDARGLALDYTWNAANELIAIDYPSLNGDAAGSILYGYDDAGRRTSMSDPTGSTSWEYDAAGRPIEVAGPQGVIGYEYDDAGRRTAMELASGRTVEYAYNAVSELTHITDWESRTTELTYTPLGALDTVVRPNGISTDYDYDAAGRLTVVEHADGATMLARFAYGLDNNGNRQQVVITGSAVTNATETYTYDELDRLISASYGVGSYVEWEYDANGNRTEQSDSANVTTYSYNAADELTSSSGAFNMSYAYDNNGNRISAGADTFQYDWKNRLRAANVGAVDVSYRYTGDGLRAERTQGSTTVEYLWDREAGLPEIVDDGSSVFLQFDEGELASIAKTSTSDATYALPDGLGSARARTDDAGAVVGTANWDAWGNARTSSGVQGSAGWAGEATDSATGLTHLRSRDYSPGTGRFVQRDTVAPNAGGAQGYNPYWYGNANPVTMTDPAGTSAQVHGDLIDAAGAAAMKGLEAVLGAINKVLGSFNTLPPIARRLLMTIIEMVIISLVVLIITTVWQYVVKPLVGPIANLPMFGASFLARFMTWIRSSSSLFLRDCVKTTRSICTIASKILPKLPTVARCAAGVTADVAAAAGGINTHGVASEITCRGANEKKNAGKLRKNMEEKHGVRKEAWEEPHHIVAGGDHRASRSKDYLWDKFGIGTNDADNGVFLPAEVSSPNPQQKAIHGIIHTDAYYAYVERGVLAATSEEEARAFLRFVGQRLEGGWNGR